MKTERTMSVAITQLHRSSWNRNQGGHYKIELPVGHSISCSTYSQTSSSAYYCSSQKFSLCLFPSEMYRVGCRITTTRQECGGGSSSRSCMVIRTYIHHVGDRKWMWSRRICWIDSTLATLLLLVCLCLCWTEFLPSTWASLPGIIMRYHMHQTDRVCRRLELSREEEEEAWAHK